VGNKKCVGKNMKTFMKKAIAFFDSETKKLIGFTYLEGKKGIIKNEEVRKWLKVNKE
jgi:hypothetical protein